MQAFADHVAQGGSVYVDANQLANALQQSGIDINQAMADIPSIGEQFQQKVAAGQHIKIPAGEFLTKVAGTNYAQAMLDHLKTDPNDWSQAEADDVVKGNNEAAKAEVERIIKVQRDRDAHEASADVVRKNFEDQLNTANRFSKDVNKAYALMISSFYSVTAARLGITPEQMADMYQLQVKAENVGQAANTLKQDIEAAPEGSYVSWVINNDPVFDEEGNETAGEDYALIEKIFVPKESRGRGAGRALLRNALREITAAHPGMDIKLAALPFDDGMDMEDLVSFYESEGFDVDNTDGDAVVMKFDGRIRGSTLNQSPAALPDTIDMDGQQFPTMDSSGRQIHYVVKDDNGDPISFYHGGDGAFSGTHDNGRFGSAIFVRQGKPSGYGKHQQVLHLKEGAILELDQLASELNSDTGRAILSDAIRTSDDDVVDAVAKALTDGGHYPDDPGVWDAIGAIDEADAQVEIQTLRGKVARALGFGAVRTPDEFDGETVMVLDNSAIIMPGSTLNQSPAALPDTIDIDPQNPNILMQSAFHGSPHKFDKFTLDHIGSGEGTQAYGWGLYFAGDKQVAEWYREQLSGADKGQLYEVSIPDDGAYGLWDVPLSKQPEVVKNAIRKIVDARFGEGTFDSYAKDGNDWNDLTDNLLEDMTDEELSRALNTEGVTGIKYLDGNSRGTEKESYNYVIFDDEAIQVLNTFYQNNQNNQAPLAEISFANDITSTPTVITLLKGANLSSFIHESGHFFLEVLADISSRPNAPLVLIDDFKTVMDWFGVTREQWATMTLEEKRPYHEQFARGFEVYAWEGKAPSLALAKLFQRYRAWMLDAYKKLLDAFNNKDLGKALDVKLSNEVRSVMDRMLATQEQIYEANAARGYMPAFATKEEAEAAGVDWDEYRANFEQADQDAITALESRSLRDMQWFRNAHNKEVRRLRREAAGLRREARIAARAEVLSHPVYRVMQFLTAPVDTLKVKKAKGDPNVVDPATDTLLVAVAKLGGLQRDMAIDQFGLDPADFKHPPVFGKHVLRRNGGMTPDGMAEALAQLGYMPSKFGESWDMNDLGDFLHDEGKGIPHYSATFDYRTLEDKTGGMQDLEANPFAGGRIDRESMVREYGGSTEEFPWEKLGGMLSNDGIHPDVIADQFGFQSGDEMIRWLLEAKDMVTAIEDRTDQIMLERHGDLTSKEAIEKAADEAIHNRMRAKVLATEANALSKTLGARGITAKAARIFAERILAGMRIIDIKPAHFAAEEAKAAARFERALKKGNSTKTENQKVNVNDLALEKRNQLVNNIATRLAYDAEAEIEKAVKHFKQLQKPGSQKAMRGEYLEQLNILLERFELRGAGNTKKAIKKADTLPKFADWLQAKAEELGAPTPDMVAFVLDGGVRKPYRDMTLEEFRGLVDAVKQLEHLARREQKQYMEIRGMEFEQEKNAILDRLRQFHPEAFDADGKPKGQAPDFVPSLKAKLGDNADSMLGEFLGNETIINILEGGELGLLHESFFKRISDRSNWRTTRLEGVFKKLEPLFDQYSIMEKRAFSMKDIGGEIGIPITREKALGVALLVGNAEGRERVRNYGWTDEQIIKIIDLLDERDKRLAEGIWDLFDNDLWPDLKALNERTAGKAPPKVEATPFTNRLGTWPGGYMRLKYDTDLDERAYKFDVEQSLSDLRNGMGMTGKTPQGTSQERKKVVLMRPRLDFGVFVETVTETVHDIAYREAVSDVIRLLNDKEIQAAIKQSAGVETFRAMRRRVAEVAARPRDPYGFIEKFVSIARRNTIVTLMSGVGTAFQNFTGYIPATGRVNAWLLSREVAKFGRHPKKMYEFATSRSEYMRHRFTSYEQYLVNTAKNLTVNGSMMPDTATFLALMGWIDRVVSVPVWNAAFAEGMEKYRADTSLAVEYADHVVRQTQGSGRIVDKAGIMTGHPLKTIFTMFYSYFNSQLQQLVRAGLISKQEAKTNPRKAAGRVAMAFVVFWILPALVTEMFRRTPDDEDDEEKAARYAKGLLLYPAAMFPIVRDIAPWAWDKYVADSGWARSFRMSPVESAVEGVAKGIESTVDIGKGDGDQQDVKNLLMGVGFTFGVPGKLISDFVTGTYNFATGEAGPQAMLLGPEPTKK
jgi:GNAT superfamily N-acetyltransferase